jgi:hypothetical protein
MLESEAQIISMAECPEHQHSLKVLSARKTSGAIHCRNLRACDNPLAPRADGRHGATSGLPRIWELMAISPLSFLTGGGSPASRLLAAGLSWSNYQTTLSGCLKVQDVFLVGIGFRINKHSTQPEFRRLFVTHAMTIMTPYLGQNTELQFVETRYKPLRFDFWHVRGMGQDGTM